MKSMLIACTALAAIGCAVNQPDHFYVLAPQPEQPVEQHPAPSLQAALRMSIPPELDRQQMVLKTSEDTVEVLEHERWAAPLGDLVRQTLARDLERGTPGLMLGAVGAERAQTALLIVVDIVQLSIDRHHPALIEAQWRIKDPRSGKSTQGSVSLNAANASQDFPGAVRALSETLSALARHLTAEITQLE